MKKLKLQVQMTVDGFVAGPNGELDWMMWDWDDELSQYVTELTNSIDTILLGRKMTDGFIVMIDSSRPETFREARSILETFRVYAPTPYVVAANKQDLEDSWEIDDVRIALRLSDDIKLLPCTAINRESVKKVLLELLYSILAEMEKSQI